jgi:uncharacterized protein (TIGR04255 family)
MVSLDRSLPDYSDPPLQEVVIGVQFSPPQSYSSVHAYGIWDLFRAEFPKVQEVPPLDPQVETFGGVRGRPEPQITFGPPPVRGRLWFISDDDSHLIQFQENRFLLNWRRRPKNAKYPRFSGILSSFTSKFEALASYIQSELSASLKINQAELTYVNHIDVESFSQASNWLQLPNSSNSNVESLNYKSVEIEESKANEPYARLFSEIQSVIKTDGKKKALRWSLLFRGKPKGTEISDCNQFFEQAHYRIVTRFDQFATTRANQMWGKME